MGDFVLALVSIVSGLGAVTAFGMAFHHHWQIIAGQHQASEVDRAE